MITEQDLKAAIAECQGKRNPDANTCKNLAAYYIIYDHMYGGGGGLPSQTQSYSEDIGYTSDSEFMRIIEGKDTASVYRVFDELMDTLNAVQPRLYQAVMRKLND